MQLGFNGATTMTSSLETDIRAAGEAGFEVLEITAAKLDSYLTSHALPELRKLLKTARLKPHAINSIERINFRNESGFTEVLARTRKLSEYASELACPWIIAVPGPAAEGTTWETIRSLTVSCLRTMSEVAEPSGVGIAFEFLGFPWCSVRTVSQAWEIVQRAGRGNLGMVIDTCHFYAGGSTLDSIRTIAPEKLAILHINDVEPIRRESITDANRLFPGDGVIQLGEILAALRGIGYQGVASVEIFRPEYWQRDPLLVAKEAKSKSERVLEL